ncbi:hypothetical protein MNBD_BACTEROID06-1228 [hydrothermal vent metagenome]|uniref:Uncharacterized protein n=1 Tax=hydrothermal vent metagenome TaxID=652676 RepID=A0A3B0U8D4_9ZZZZ
MKKKNTIFLLVIAIQFLFANISFASSVWFNNPTNGEVITLTTSKTTVLVNLQYGKSISSGYGGFVKLFAHNNIEQSSQSDDGIQQLWYLTPGTYTWKLELWEYDILHQMDKKAETTITFHVKHTITVKNIFNAGSIINPAEINRNI